MKRDVPRLTELLCLLPEGRKAAFEFRNYTRFSDDVYDAFEAAGAASGSAPGGSTASKSPLPRGPTTAVAAGR